MPHTRLGQHHRRTADTTQTRERVRGLWCARCVRNTSICEWNGPPVRPASRHACRGLLWKLKMNYFFLGKLANLDESFFVCNGNFGKKVCWGQHFRYVAAWSRFQAFYKNFCWLGFWMYHFFPVIKVEGLGWRMVHDSKDELNIPANSHRCGSLYELKGLFTSRSAFFFHITPRRTGV